MKKSLVLMVVLVGSLALAGSVFAGGMAKAPAPQVVGAGTAIPLRPANRLPAKTGFCAKARLKV